MTRVRTDNGLTIKKKKKTGENIIRHSDFSLHGVSNKKITSENMADGSGLHARPSSLTHRRYRPILYIHRFTVSRTMILCLHRRRPPQHPPSSQHAAVHSWRSSRLSWYAAPVAYDVFFYRVQDHGCTLSKYDKINFFL